MSLTRPYLSILSKNKTFQFILQVFRWEILIFDTLISFLIENFTALKVQHYKGSIYTLAHFCVSRVNAGSALLQSAGTGTSQSQDTCTVKIQ